MATPRRTPQQMHAGAREMETGNRVFYNVLWRTRPASFCHTEHAARVLVQANPGLEPRAIRKWEPNRGWVDIEVFVDNGRVFVVGGVGGEPEPDIEMDRRRG